MQKTHDNNNTSAKEKANQPSKDTTPSNLGGPANLNQFTPPPPPQTQQGPVDDNDDGDIILDGDQKEVNFSKTDTDSYSFSGDNIRSENRTKEEVNKVIIHWDAALNVDDQHRTLQNKGLSTHFGIGNDGTIYQFLDPSRAVAYHASPHNSDSIGIDISNAVYKKYQQTYIDRGHGERPIITNSKVHGRKYQGGEHLGYYEEQIEALSALMSRLLQFYNIPTQAPSHYNLIKDVGELEGVFGHLHVDPEKFDPAGLNFSEILS